MVIYRQCMILRKCLSKLDKIGQGCMHRKQYTYRVICSEEDNQYVGLCAEFPSLSWLDADQSKALSGIIELVAAVVADMNVNQEK